MAGWIDETLPYDSPSQALARTTTTGVELHGTTIPAQFRILLLVGSANRDPRVFPDPDRFDLDRGTGSALSFGSGRHHCLGANLSRLETRIALEEIVVTVLTGRSRLLVVDGRFSRRGRSGGYRRRRPKPRSGR